MNEMWIRVPCSASSCPEWRRANSEGWIELRTSDVPDEMIVFTPAEWEALGEAFKRGDLDQDTP
jgi:hypothetical protein